MYMECTNTQQFIDQKKIKNIIVKLSKNFSIIVVLFEKTKSHNKMIKIHNMNKLVNHYIKNLYLRALSPLTP